MHQNVIKRSTFVLLFFKTRQKPIPPESRLLCLLCNLNFHFEAVAGVIFVMSRFVVYIALYFCSITPPPPPPPPSQPPPPFYMGLCQNRQKSWKRAPCKCWLVWLGTSPFTQVCVWECSFKMMQSRDLKWTVSWREWIDWAHGAIREFLEDMHM